MYNNKTKLVKNPRQDASLLSIITSKWLFRTFFTGYKRELEISDLYSPLDEHSSQVLGDKLSRLWTQELEKCKKLKKNPSLLTVLARCFGCNILTLSLWLAFTELTVKLMQPLILANILKYFNGNHTMERTEAYYWGTGLLLTFFVDSFITQNGLQGLLQEGIKIRVACCSLIYRKVLKITKVVSKDKTSAGEIINLLSNDVSRFDTSVHTLPYVWIAPLQAVFILYLLYREVGVAVVGGLVILLLFICVNGFYGKLASYLTSQIAYHTDERLRLTNSIINGVKVIKMYAWEKPFAYLNDKAREKEVKFMRNESILFEIIFSFENYIPRLCIFVTTLLYFLFGNNIDAEKIYLATAYYNVLRQSFFQFLPFGINEASGALISVYRIQKFLLLEETEQKLLVNNNINCKADDKISLALNNVTCKWDLKSKFEAVKHISFQLQAGSLTAVIGQVGAGKTTLFQAILNEISHKQGEIKINGKISYASQESWIFTSSIKQNILFGEPMIKERYERVIEVCQLKQDFKILPYGDNTLIGEKGINLSGGQCARINIARAVYREADIYLLDDPLSAVDSKVGKNIFENCIKTFLNGKTVVLIMHQFQYLNEVDRIILLDNGTMKIDGTYANVLNSGLSITKMIQCESESNEISDNEKNPAKRDEVTEETVTSSIIVEKEQSESTSAGSTTSNTYLQYFKAARNCCLVFLVFLTAAFCQISVSCADYFVTYWINVEEEGRMFTSSSAHTFLRGRDWYIFVYSLIMILSVLTTLAQAYTFFHMCMKISRNLHAMMFNSIIKTKMAFFNANPIGRIMNRFSKDMGMIDTRIQETMHEVLHLVLYTSIAVGIIASLNPWFLIAALIVALTIYVFKSFYLKTSRMISRLERITQSPVFNHLNASVQGLTTIRASNAQQILTNEFDNLQNLHSSSLFIFLSSGTAFEMYIQCLCMLFMGIIMYALISLTDTTKAGDVGLALTQCSSLIMSMRFSIRELAELENHVVSVERILEYSKLEPEPFLERIPTTKTPEKWPQQGQISFKSVSLVYERQKIPALQNLNFIIKAKETIGIVGRTGAGKSSIINALFRLYDIQGEIYIDNIPTSKVALQDLRSKISIIPQEPILFIGSLRHNLDPLKEYSDHVIWQALEDVELKAFLKSDLGLDIKITEGGANFSVGQRQLLCLARAILKNNKLLVLDEATASVDPQTDELIQKVVRKKFVNSTVIVIAHRLNTVMDSNKILVMDAGRIVEFDHPYKLLQQKNGVFYNMVQQTGSSTAENLLQIAKLNYENTYLHRTSENI